MNDDYKIYGLRRIAIWALLFIASWAVVGAVTMFCIALLRSFTS